FRWVICRSPSNCATRFWCPSTLLWRLIRGRRGRALVRPLEGAQNQFCHVTSTRLCRRRMLDDDFIALDPPRSCAGVPRPGRRSRPSRTVEKDVAEEFRVVVVRQDPAKRRLGAEILGEPLMRTDAAPHVGRVARPFEASGIKPMGLLD